MKDEYRSEKGTYPAYVIVQEDELNALIEKSAGYKTIDDVNPLHNVALTEVKTTATGRTSPTEEHPEGLSLEDIGF